MQFTGLRGAIQTPPDGRGHLLQSISSVSRDGRRRYGTVFSVSGLLTVRASIPSTVGVLKARTFGRGINGACILVRGRRMLRGAHGSIVLHYTAPSGCGRMCERIAGQVEDGWRLSGETRPWAR